MATNTHLDDMMTVEQAAPWMQMSIRELRAKSKGRKAAIPAFRINGRVVRYCRRIIIAKLAKDAGMTEPLIAAAFGQEVAQ